MLLLNKQMNMLKKNDLYVGKDKDLLTVENGAALVNGLLEQAGITDVKIEYEGSTYKEDDAYKEYAKKSESKDEYLCGLRIYTYDSTDTKGYGHSVSVESNSLESDSCSGKIANIKIKDTSKVGRNKLRGDSAGRTNEFRRMDFFKVVRTQKKED